MRLTLIITIFIIILHNLSAKPITLETGIELALKNNLSLQASSQNIAIADGLYREVRSSLLPQIQFTGGYQLSKTELPSAWIPDKFDVSGLLSDSADDDTQLLAEVLEQGFNSMLPNKTQEETNFVAGVKLDQVVYLGGKLLAGIRAASNYKDLERLRYELARQNVIFDTIELFYQGLLLDDVLELNEQALDLAKQHFDRVQKMNRQGLVSEFDTIRAELELMKLQPALQEAENNYKLWQEAFRKHLGLEEQNFSLEGIIEMPKVFETTSEDAINIAEGNRLELLLMGTMRDMYEIQYRAEKGNYLPNVVLSAEYNTFSQRNEFEITPDKFGSSYQVMLGLQLPIFKGFGNRAKVTQTRHEFRKANFEYLDLYNKIELDIRNAVQNLTHSRLNYEAQKKRVELAEKGLSIANARYENQVGINLEVLDAQMEYSVAQLAYKQAIYEITMAQKRLQKAMGINLFYTDNEK